MIEKLRAAGVDFGRVEVSVAPQVLAGKAVVVTGTLDGWSREEAEAAIKDRGGKSPGSVSAKTFAVVVGRDPGASKVTKAESLNVPMLDEAALATRLASGRLGGAYLDVFHQEPLPPDSTFWDLPNVIISPHDSARSAGTQPRVDAIFLEELGRWLRGEESPRRVRAE